jgi:hypothetical protein
MMQVVSAPITSIPTMSTAGKGKGKGKGKPNNAGVKGRGGGARTARKLAYEEELKQLEQGIQQLVSQYHIIKKGYS